MVTIVIEILKDSKIDKYEFVLLKEKEDLLNSLDELARETVIDGLVAQTYMGNYIKEAYSLLYTNLKKSFQKIDKDNRSKFVHINTDGIIKENTSGEEVSKSKVKFVASYLETLLSLWIYWLCANGFLSKKSVSPRFSINVNSNVVQKNSHLFKAELALLALYGSTDSSLEVLEDLDLLDIEKKGILTTFLDYFRKNSPKRSDYSDLPPITLPS